MNLKLGKNGFEQSKDRLTVESFKKDPVPVSVSCDRNECQETAESMERKACEKLSNIVGQTVVTSSFNTDIKDFAYIKENKTYYETHNFSVELKKIEL